MEEDTTKKTDKELSRTHKPWEYSEDKLHHRHAPTFSRWTHAISWKLAHLYWPIFVHYMTDKYVGRLHHLIVDIIYAVISLVLLFANIGLAIWFYLYFTPPSIEVRVQSPSVVRSGQDMLIAATYANGQRELQDVEIDFILPKGFLYEQEEARPPFDLESVDKGEVGQVFARGQVYGSVGTTYDVLAVIRYTYLGKEYSQIAAHSFTVNYESFTMSFELPTTVTYNIPIKAVLKYHNESEVDRKNVRLQLQLPDNFRVIAVREGDLVLNYDPAAQLIVIPKVAADQSGEVVIEGEFIRALGEIVGDIHQQFGVSATTSLDTPLGEIDEDFTTGVTGAGFNVVVPRASLTATISEAVQFGETIVGTVSVTNIGDEPLQNIDLRATVQGAPVQATSLRVSAINGARVSVVPSVTGNDAYFDNIVAELPEGETATIQYYLPTAVVDGQQISSRIAFSGSAFVPILNIDMPIIGQTVETKYNSRVNLASTAIYYGPAGEQLGFGPYPPRAWEETAFRVLLRVTNLNNPLTNVRVSAELPGQIDWTNLYSVSAGTTISFNEATRVLTWTVPRLDPSSTGYGAQFEVILYPNHLQIGQKPHLVNDLEIVATDAFTGETVTQIEGAVITPVSIEE